MMSNLMHGPIDFKNKTKSGVHFIKVGTPNCPPCGMLSNSVIPHLEEMNPEVSFWEVDATTINGGKLAQQWGVTRVPRVLIYKDGVKTSDIQGLESADFYHQRLS